MATNYTLPRSARDQASENSNSPYAIVPSTRSIVDTARSKAPSSLVDMNEKSSPAPSKQRKNTSIPNDDEQTLIKDIVAMPPNIIRALLKKYESALRSAQDFESHPFNLLVYCLIKMERRGADIHANTLLQEFYDLEDTHSGDFLKWLQVELKCVTLIDFSNLTASETVGSDESRVGSSTQNDTTSEDSGPEIGGEDIVDGWSHTSIGASVSLESSVDSGFISNLLEHPDSTCTKPSSHTKRIGISSSEAVSQAKTTQTSTQLKEGLASRAKEGKNNTRIQEVLFAINNENILLENCRLCVKCRERPRGITFLPCGHFTMCRECAGPTYVCSLCHKNVLATVDTFLS